MAIRGGVAHLVLGIEEGRTVLAYSGGPHHVQAPGERRPRPFRTLRMRLERVDVERYRTRLLNEAGREGFKGAVMSDLDRRRDRHSRAPPRP